MIKKKLPKKGVSYTRFTNKETGKQTYAKVRVGNAIDKMNSAMCVPSAVHGYSLAVEYFRDWFLSKFEKGYFKTVFINGRHILQDYMRYSEISMIKQEKPAVAITPLANFEHDREEQDSYIGGRDMLIGKFNHQQCFFKDYENNQFIGMGVRELEVEFNTRVRVESRAQQMDIYRHMEMACRVGYTQYEYISADFHIPLEIIKNIAVGAGFELDEQEEVKDPINFVKYLNAHSEMPILYKLRTINGKSEYFVRVNRVYAHISVKDKLSRDDGDKEGVLENNFHVEMTATLHMWVPSYYVIMTAKPVYKYIPVVDSSMFGLYTMKIVDIPDVNENNWNLYIKTEWEMSLEKFKEGKCDIDISSLTYNTEIRKVIQEHLNMGISPSRFMDVKILDYDRSINYTMEWNRLMIHVENPKSMKLEIAIYIDTEYYNEFRETTMNLNKTRYNEGSET